MPLLGLLIVAWGVDLFVLPRRFAMSLEFPFLRIHKILFLLCVLFFVIPFEKFLQRYIIKVPLI